MQQGKTYTYPASYDKTTKVVSIVAAVFLLGMAVLTKNPFVLGLSCVILLGAYAYSPRAYTIAGRSIAVRRLVGNVCIPLEGIRHARTATAEDCRGSIRLWGSGGLFGYYGLFRTSSLGKCTWYVTNRRNVVVVETAGKTALFSPDNVEGFLAAVRGPVPVTESSPGISGTAPVGFRRGLGFTAPFLGGVFGVAAMAVVVFAMLFSPGPPAYTLTRDSLVIRDRFYPVTLEASAVDLARVRIVDVTADAEWRPTMRTNGFANPHYRSGWFRVASGRTVRLYRADGTRLVLPPPKGNGPTVLIETANPEDFVQALQQQWSGKP